MPAPSTPTGLIGARNTANVNLFWNKVAGASSYNIYRDNINIGSAASNIFVDSSTTLSTIYVYTVTAVNLSGESAQSNNYIAWSGVLPTSWPDGAVHVASGQTLVATNNIYATVVTVDAGGTLDMNNWQLFYRDPSTNNGHIHNDGNPASGTTPGAAKPDGFYKSQGAGMGGKTGPHPTYGSVDGSDGLDGTTRDTCLQAQFSPLLIHSGNGGDGSSTCGGSIVTDRGKGGSYGSSSTVTQVITPTLDQIVKAIVQTYISPLPGGPAAAGSGGGDIRNGACGPGADSGACGGPAGFLYCQGPKWYGTGTFSSNGGPGSDGGEGSLGNYPFVDPRGNRLTRSGGGGGGGGGIGGPPGWVILATPDMSEFTGTIEAKYGTPGKGGLAQETNYSDDPGDSLSVIACTGIGVTPTVITLQYNTPAEEIACIYVSGVGGNTIVNNEYFLTPTPPAPDATIAGAVISLTNVTGNGNWTSGGQVSFGSPAYASTPGQDATSGPDGQIFVDYIPAPTGLVGIRTLQNPIVNLSWDAYPIPNVIAYNVYSNGNLLAQSPTNSFTDNTAIINNSYTYNVTATFSFVETMESAPAYLPGLLYASDDGAGGVKQFDTHGTGRAGLVMNLKGIRQ